MAHKYPEYDAGIWNKHLRPVGKRFANKGIRRGSKMEAEHWGEGGQRPRAVSCRSRRGYARTLELEYKVRDEYEARGFLSPREWKPYYVKYTTERARQNACAQLNKCRRFWEYRIPA